MNKKNPKTVEIEKVGGQTGGKPDRIGSSVYDIIKQNMAKAQRAAFLLQVAYMGCFSPSLGHMTVYQLISEDLDLQVENDYNSVTGLLLMHKDCFINKITCSQDVAFEHFKRLLLSGEVTNLKILHYYPHTRQRQFKNWYMLYVSPLLTRTGRPEKAPAKDGGPAKDAATEGNSAAAEGEDTAEDTATDDAMGAVLEVFKMFNELSMYLQLRSNGYLQVSATEKLARAVTYLIPTPDQIRLSCHQSFLRNVSELLEDYHQIRHVKFSADEIWPIPATSAGIWGPLSTEETTSQHEDEDNQSTLNV